MRHAFDRKCKLLAVRKNISILMSVFRDQERRMNLGQKGLSIGNVQEFNRRVILSAMHELGPCSRKDISLASGLDQATVTRAIGVLIEDGIVEEVGFVKGGRGRRSISLSFACSGRTIICVRLQRRNFSVGLYSLAGETLEETEDRILKDQPPAQTFDQITACVDRLIALNPQIDGMGVAVPGPFLERDERVILMNREPGLAGLRSRSFAPGAIRRNPGLLDPRCQSGRFDRMAGAGEAVRRQGAALHFGRAGHWLGIGNQWRSLSRKPRAGGGTRAYLDRRERTALQVRQSWLSRAVHLSHRASPRRARIRGRKP